MASRITRRALVAGIGAAALLCDAAAQPGGFRVLRARAGGARLRGAERDPGSVWGFDDVPGPLLRVKRGEELKVRLVNDLPAGVTLHWHGVRVPNPMDGVPGLTQQPVAPGASFDYRFAPPDAGTFWYRVPLRDAETRALHGLLIVDEAEPIDVDRDVALVLDAWPPAPEGSHFTVNGLPALDIPVVAHERIRLRLLNAATGFMTLRIDRHPVHVMAIDGQPAERFMAQAGRITLSPGNRADLFVDAVLEAGSIAPIVLQVDGADLAVARLLYDAARPGAIRPEPKPLPANPLPARMDFRGALRVELDANGSSDLPAKPLFSVKRGRTVQLAIRNGASHPAALHIHGHHVRLLDARDDGWKPFWLDTVLSLPQAITRVAFVADNPGKWLLHARAIGAEAQSLAWFEVS